MLKLTIQEGGVIDIPEGHDRRVIYEQLARAAETLKINAFRWKRSKLYAAEVVGCIQTQGVQLNILPKLDTREDERDENFLFNFLEFSGQISKPRFSVAQTRKTTFGPLEIIVSQLASGIEDALREGMPRRYQEKREDSPSIRGKIDFPRLSTRPPGNTLIPILHSPLSSGNRLSQAIKYIAGVLYGRTTSSTNRQRLGAILEQLSHISDRNFSARELSLMKLSRHEAQWEQTISIGAMLSAGHSPDPTFCGDNSAFSLIFKLEHLFERSMRRIISDSVKHLGLNVVYSPPLRFLLNEPSSQTGVVQLKPDYILCREGEFIAVADAKWKRLDETKRAYGVERDDLFQINAYVERFKVLTGIIFVPKRPWMQTGWNMVYETPERDSKIHMVGVDLERLLSRNEGVKEKAYSELSEVLEGILT